MVYRHTPTARGEPCPWRATLPAAEQHDDAWWRACLSWQGCEKRCAEHRRAQLEAQRLRRLDHNPRAFPFVNLRAGRREHCQWCGDQITTSRARQRGWHDGREGEPDCLAAYYLHTRPEYQKSFLLRRDGLGCWTCGKPIGQWGLVFRVDNAEVYTAQTAGTVSGQRWRCDGPVSFIMWSTGLELEHETPLWKVQHLPDDERAAYFGPENLRLRCHACHLEKTRAEAAERAAARRSVSRP